MLLVTVQYFSTIIMSMYEKKEKKNIQDNTQDKNTFKMIKEWHVITSTKKKKK